MGLPYFPIDWGILGSMYVYIPCKLPCIGSVWDRHGPWPLSKRNMVKVEDPFSMSLFP